MTLFGEAFGVLERVEPMLLVGTVSEVRGLTVRVSDLALPVGAMVDIVSGGERRVGEVVGFDDDQTIVMLMGFTSGIRRGDRVLGRQASATAPVGEDLLGRVVDALGRPRDNGPALREMRQRPVMPDPTDPMHRVSIDEPLGTGVRAIDTMLTVGRGQRLGIFAGPGIGKSTLLGQIARDTDADVSVIALVGERGREVSDFIERSLGPEGLARSVVVAATGDEPALLRVRAAMYALTVAEHFRDTGRDVVVFMDSVTRFCHAQRQIGLAIGEPPATRGYTPSVFAMLPTLIERCGRTRDGSITGFYSVLVEGDDMTEPVADACRGILDGHVVLSRKLAGEAHWPAIDVVDSISRLARDVTDRAHQAARDEVLRLISQYRQVEDLVNIGAYAAGSNPMADLAIEMKDSIDLLLRQPAEDHAPFDKARGQLLALGQMIAQRAGQMARGQQAQAQAQGQAQGQGRPAR